MIITKPSKTINNNNNNNEKIEQTIKIDIKLKSKVRVNEFIHLSEFLILY